MYNITVFNKFNMILNPYLSTIFKSIYYAVIDNPIKTQFKGLSHFEIPIWHFLWHIERAILTFRIIYKHTESMWHVFGIFPRMKRGKTEVSPTRVPMATGAVVPGTRKSPLTPVHPTTSRRNLVSLIQKHKPSPKNTGLCKRRNPNLEISNFPPKKS